MYVRYCLKYNILRVKQPRGTVPPFTGLGSERQWHKRIPTGQQDRAEYILHVFGPKLASAFTKLTLLTNLFFNLVERERQTKKKRIDIDCHRTYSGEIIEIESSRITKEKYYSRRFLLATIIFKLKKKRKKYKSWCNVLLELKIKF